MSENTRKVYSGYTDEILKSRHRELRCRGTGTVDDPEIDSEAIEDAVIQAEYEVELEAEIRTSSKKDGSNSR